MTERVVPEETILTLPSNFHTLETVGPVPVHGASLSLWQDFLIGDESATDGFSLLGRLWATNGLLPLAGQFHAQKLLDSPPGNTLKVGG